MDNGLRGICPVGLNSLLDRASSTMGKSHWGTEERLYFKVVTENSLFPPKKSKHLHFDIWHRHKSPAEEAGNSSFRLSVFTYFTWNLSWRVTKALNGRVPLRGTILESWVRPWHDTRTQWYPEQPLAGHVLHNTAPAAERPRAASFRVFVPGRRENRLLGKRVLCKCIHLPMENWLTGTQTRFHTQFSFKKSFRKSRVSGTFTVRFWTPTWQHAKLWT